MLIYRNLAGGKSMGKSNPYISICSQNTEPSAHAPYPKNKYIKRIFRY